MQAGSRLLGHAGRGRHARLGPEVSGAIGTPKTGPEEYLDVYQHDAEFAADVEAFLAGAS